MEQMHFCQSCGMPLLGEQDKGTEAGGARSEDYCTYCYQDGAFTPVSYTHLDVYKRQV